jgi:hypothetical protein
VRKLRRSQDEAVYVLTQARALPSEGYRSYLINYSNNERIMNFNEPFHYRHKIVSFLTTAQKERLFGGNKDQSKKHHSSFNLNGPLH